MIEVGVAVAAFQTLKSGINAGKELHNMSKEIATLWDNIDGINQAHNKKKNSAFKSVNEEALDTFVAKQKAKDMEDQLREMIIYTRGMNAWQELVKIRATIRKERIAEAKRKRDRIRRVFEIMILVVTMVVGIGVLASFAYYLLELQRGKI